LIMKTLLISLVFLVATVVAASSGKCGTATWTYDKNVGVLSGDGSSVDCDLCLGVMKQASKIIIESGVVSIGDYVFQNCGKSLLTLNISETVVSIGENAFGALRYMSTIIVHEDNPVFSIEGNILYNKDKTKLIRFPPGRSQYGPPTIPNTVNTIDGFAFANCSFPNVTIPDSVSSIGIGAFANCPDIKTFIISGSNNHFKFENGFLMSKNGETIYTGINVGDSVAIPDSVRNILDYAFAGNNKMNSIDLNKVDTIGSYAFYGCQFNAEVVIPNSVTSVGPYAFAKCQRMTSVKIGDGVTIIHNYTFALDEKLTSVKIGENVKTVGYRAFDDCKVLVFEEYDNGFYLGPESNKHRILYKAKSSDVTSCTVHSDTEEIAEYSFYQISSMKSLTISNNVKTIGQYAFAQNNLEALSLGNKIEIIGDYAFYMSLKTESLTIPDSVTYIGHSAFYGPYQSVLTKMTIGKKVSFIGNYALCCYQLEELEIPDSVKTIGVGAFYSMAKLKTLKIGKGVETLPVRAFYGSVSLETLKVDSDNQYFKSVDNVLYDKDGKTLIFCAAQKDSIEIEKTVTTLGDVCFANCNKLKKVTIPKSVTSLGKDVFTYATGLEKISVSDDNPSFKSKNGYLLSKNGTVLLEPPRGKKTIIIPSSVTHIPPYACNGCQAVSVIIGDNVKSIGEKAFYLLSEVEEISLGGGVTHIEKYAFAHLNKLKKFCYLGKTDLDVVIFDGVQLTLVVNVPLDYQSNTFCHKSIEKTDQCIVEGQDSDSDSEPDPYGSGNSNVPSGNSDSRPTSVSGSEMKAIPFNWVIAIAAWFFSAMFFILH